jgi:hypothetical protein
MATWPPSLPQAPLLDGLSEAYGDGVIRTDMDVGVPKRRRRYTFTPRRFPIGVVLSEDQAATFDTFFVTTLAEGEAPFDWTHPRTGSSVSLAFVGPPRLVPLGAGFWRADFELETQAP